MRFTPLAGLLAVVGLLGLAPSDARADAKIYQQTLQSTTWVIAKNSGGVSRGSGVLVNAEQKLVVTNYHVVGDSRAAVLFFPEFVDGKLDTVSQSYLDKAAKLGIRGRVIATDRKRDLALIQLERLPETAKAIELAPESAGPGEEVESVGNPGASDALWVYTSGSVRAVYRKQFRSGAGEHDFSVVETQSPINTGDSGGPVVNSSGQLVAINQSIAPTGRLISWCVDVAEVKAFLAGPWKPAPLPVTELLTRAELTYTQHATGHYEIQIEGADKQKLSVFITKDVEYYERADVRRIWSQAQTTREKPTLEVAMKLLEQSARTKLGAWSVEQSQTGEYLILYSVKLDATASPDALKSTVEYVAKLTTLMKKELATAPKAQAASSTLDDWLGEK